MSFRLSHSFRFVSVVLALNGNLVCRAEAEKIRSNEPMQFRPGSALGTAAAQVASNFNAHHGTYRGLLPERALTNQQEVVVMQREAEVAIDSKGLGLKWAVADLGILTASYTYADLAKVGVARARTQYLSPEVSSWYQSVYVRSVGLMLFKQQVVPSAGHAKEYQWAPDLVIVARPSDPQGPPAVFYRYDQVERRKMFEQLVAASQRSEVPNAVYLFEQGERDKQTNWQIFTSYQP